MERGNSTTGFYTKKKFETPTVTNNTAKMWEQNNMYRTSYFQMSEKNVNKNNLFLKQANALKNSTEQILNTKSNKLREISPQNQFYTKPIENNDFLNHDYFHHYRTSYNDMSKKVTSLYKLKLKNKNLTDSSKFFYYKKLIKIIK